MARVKRFNERIAVIIANATGSMLFFWAALAFCIALRALYPPKMSDLLLNLENDLQLLLLAVNAVVGANLYANQMRQLANQGQVLANQDAMLAQIENLLNAVEEREERIAEETEQELKALADLPGKIQGDPDAGKPVS